MIYLKNYTVFLESTSDRLPSYQDCVRMCQSEDSPFYETKNIINGYQVSVFNYRLASYNDFLSSKAKEMRGLTFVFNKDGTLFKRYLLLEKFFNLNQVPDTMYSVVKNYKIKFISNKEDGSIASFIRLPNGEVIGKSKVEFTNDQSSGINRIYKNNKYIQQFVNWCLDSDIVAIFEYVSPKNRIVLKYPTEELILLRLRNNFTGEHIDIRQHLDKLDGIRIAPFEDDIKDLDSLIELTAKQINKEGSIVTCEDNQGRQFMFKIKTPWYVSLHSVLTEDIHRENVIIDHILNDSIDDILSQVPESYVETHQRINKITQIVRTEVNKLVDNINRAYAHFVNIGGDKKEYALNHRIGNDYFYFVMNMDKAEKIKSMSDEDIYKYYGSIEKAQQALAKCEPHFMAIESIRDNTKRLESARSWLKSIDRTLSFNNQDTEE